MTQDLGVFARRLKATLNETQKSNIQNSFDIIDENKHYRKWEEEPNFTIETLQTFNKTINDNYISSVFNKLKKTN